MTKIRDLPTDTVAQSGLESSLVSDYLSVLLRSFFSAILAERCMVPFR